MSPARLNGENLPKIAKMVAAPEYDRSNIYSGIVHVGVGNFHRAHEAFYTDQLLNLGENTWGICGICLLDKDLKMYKTLVGQNGLYSLVVKEPDGNTTVRVIGCIVDYLYAPADPTAVILKMADPGVKIISLTITEGGYNYDAPTGKFLFSEPGIQWDLQHPDRPKTIFGFLTAALLFRKNNGMPGLTVLSCDNIQQNGEVCKKMLLTYIRECQPDLAIWTENQVTFPNSMIDRITPITTEQHIADLRTEYHIEDGWPVICEPFIQWIIEDRFAQGRPGWEKAGVQFVQEVEPYEKMKIRLLNAGHSLLGFSGSLCGYKTIYETVRNPLIAEFLREYMDKEATHVLGLIEGINLEEYKNTLVQRFANPYIGDNLSRICAESSSKIPKFILPTIKEQLDRGGSLEYGVLIIATWCRYLEMKETGVYDYEIKDTMKETLIKGAKASMADDPLAFLKIKPVFGNLVQSEEFVETYLRMIGFLRKHGIGDTLRYVVKKA